MQKKEALEEYAIVKNLGKLLSKKNANVGKKEEN